MTLPTLQALLGSFSVFLFVLVDHVHVVAANRGRFGVHHPIKHHKPRFTAGPWKQAHATFYEGGSGTFGGACGYHWKPILTVTATNNCPPNWNQASDNGGWCNPPREHFDIAKPVFLNIAEYKAGIIPVTYRRVPCQKKGGIRFTITGNPYFNEVLVWNVGGAGDIISVQVKGSDKLKWTTMSRMWGQRWVTGAKMVGESLTFRVEASDRRHSTSWHVAPKTWQFGQTFEGKNFR
ncbi:hypothetical protein ACFX1S_009414 [Malus domestica]